jgi:hypothetical protein
MISGLPLKENFRALLPIVDVHKGWATYQKWFFDFKPHKDYPYKEASPAK